MVAPRFSIYLLSFVPLPQISASYCCRWPDLLTELLTYLSPPLLTDPGPPFRGLRPSSPPLTNGAALPALVIPAAAMSFRELRNFKEIMATLGYPRLISIENFKVPHFELVADALEWLCHRYDKNMEILSDIRTEQDRVAFLKSVAEQLLVKARVKLNLKNLYASNGFAVRELLKVSRCGPPLPLPRPLPLPLPQPHPSPE